MAIQSTTSTGIANVASSYQGSDDSISVKFPHTQKDSYETSVELLEYWRGRDSSSSYDERTNSFDDFVKNYFELNPLSYEENCKMLETGIKPGVDYGAEFKKYLERRGRADEGELRTLNKTHHFTVDGLKEEAREELRDFFHNTYYMDMEGVFDRSQFDKNINYILNNASLSDIVDKITNASLPTCKTVSQTRLSYYEGIKDLLSKLPPDPTGEFDIENILKSVDNMLEKLKGKAKEELKALQELDKYKMANQDQIDTMFNQANNAKKISAYNISYVSTSNTAVYL